MHKVSSLVVALIVLATAAAATRADDCSTSCPVGSGPIKVFRVVGNGLVLMQCHAAGVDFPIDVSTLSGNQTLVISGCTGSPPSDSIGLITVTAVSGGPAALFVAVVGVNQNLSTLNNRDAILV